MHYTTRITIAKFPIINFSHTFIISELPTIIDSYIKIHNTPEFLFFPFIWLLAELNPRGGLRIPSIFFLANFSYHICCDVAVAQINYPNFKHNTQDSIEQVRGRSHEEDSSQIFMLDDMQFGGGFGRYLG